MQEHETWLTALFNDHLASVGNGILSVVYPIFGVAYKAQEKPWENFIVMQILVTVIVILLFALLKGSLSMDKPGKLQHLFEAVYNFLHQQAHDNIGHGSSRFVPFVGSMFIFILFCNLLGIIPTLEAPTMFHYVTGGLAAASFLYYNYMGVRIQGLGNYSKHFLGPVWWLAPLMLPIEIISHLARPLSLTIRLFANMFAGEMVTIVFIGLTFIGIPVIFMGLHVFVSILQAYIFALMTMIYLGGAVSHDHPDELEH